MPLFYKTTHALLIHFRPILLALFLGLATLPALAQTTWTGTTNADWNTAGNWSAGVPTTTLDAVIPNKAPAPTIGAGTSAVAKSVEVQSGGTLTIASSATLTINDSKTATDGYFSFLNEGDVQNSGQLLIGNLNNAGSYGIRNKATFSNKAGGTIQIDRTYGYALYNNSGTFTNAGTITIGSITPTSVGNYGLYNAATFNNDTGGRIQIDGGQGSSLNNVSGGTFNNAATIVLGSIASVSNSGLSNSATFDNKEGGTIQIDRASNDGLSNETGGTFTNSATITIGSTSGSYNGLSNQATFNNDAGSIQIDRSGSRGIFNYSGTFTNAAAITIGANAAIGNMGIDNWATFNNHTGGTIQIDRSGTEGISNNQSGTFTNEATIKIGSLAAVGQSGISTSGTFNNKTGGTIQVDRVNTQGNGLYNGGIFTNTATIKIGSLAEVGQSGIRTFNTFKNEAGGTIQIDRVTNSGLYNGGTVTNEAMMTIGGTMATYGIFNTSTINNNCGGVITTGQIITNSNTFTNSGTIIEKASGNSSISSNTGLVQNLNGGNFTITTNSGTLTTTEGTFWTGCTSTNWATASNWSTGVVPTTADDVVILSSTPNQPTIGASTPAVANSVVVENESTLTIASSATLTINGSGTYSGSNTAFSNKGTVHNNGSLIIGNTGSINETGLINLATFNNNAGGSIRIDRTTQSGLENSGGTFTNAATIVIGASGSIGSHGLYNSSGTFTNNAGGRIQIDQTTDEGLFNLATFVNSATITIGANAAVGGSGLTNDQIFNNNAGGIIQIDRTKAHGLNNVWGTFNNAATVTIGASGTIGISGVNNEGTIYNNAGGAIQIDRSGSEGISNFGVFDNAAVITIGANASVGKYGMSCLGTFNNDTGGTLQIDRSTVAGIYFEEIINKGTVFIGASTGNAGLYPLYSGAFYNKSCGVTTLLNSVQNADNTRPSIINTGLMTVNTLQTHSNTVSLTNNGIIVYPQGNSIPNVTNNDLIVNSFSVCQSATPVLQIGGSNNFQVNTTWYKDENLTRAAGTYDQTSNTFTKTDLTGGATHALYFAVVDSENSCTRTVSVSATVSSPPTLTITANPSFTVTPGASVTLTASGTSSYSWSTGATGSSIAVTPGSSTVYSVTGTTGLCSATTSATVTLSNPANATLSGSTTLCPGLPATLSVNLTGTAPWSLTYTDGSNPVVLSGITSSPFTFTVNPAGTTTYSLVAVATQEAPTGGTVSGSAIITRSSVVPAPTLTLSNSSVIQNTPSVTLTISGCPSGLNWSGSNNTSGTGTTVSVPTATIETIVYSATCVSTCPSPPASTTISVIAPTTTGNFDGFVNGADCSSFRGWAWDRGKGNTVFNVEILDGPNVIGTLPAGDFRQDLLDAGKGNGKHAFRFTIPDALKDGLSHNLSARIAGSSFILKDSPKVLICQGGTTSPANKPPVAPSPTVLIAPLSAQVGVPFSGTLAAFTDPEGQPLTYGLSGLPSSLSINTSSRVITGTPNEAGDFTLIYTATDPQLATNSVSFVLTVSAPQTTTVTGSFEGYLDKVECGTIRGWVWDRNKPNTPVTVEFYTTNAVLGSTVANIYRDDLKTAGKGNGAHVYSFTVPTDLKDGTTRVIYGRVQGSTYVLKDSGKPLTCNSPTRLSAETALGLQVRVLGNPVLGSAIEAEIRGAEGQPLRLQLTDATGREVSTRQVNQAQAVEHQTIPVFHQPAGLFLLRATSGTHSVTLKILKP